MNEDYTAGVLAGIPYFCVNREYETAVAPHITTQYLFRFPNGYGASVVEFENRSFSGGAQYELGVMIYNGGVPELTYDTPVSGDVERGDAKDMHELICQIEKLTTCITT